MSYCDNEREHERDGRDAFRRHNRSDYEEAKRDRYEDDCKAAFVRGYERADYERREELRQQQEEEEHHRDVLRARNHYSEDFPDESPDQPA